MDPGGRSGRIEQGLLREQDIGTLGKAATLDLAFRGGDLGERATEVHGGGAGDVAVGPRDRAVEGPIHLEHPGPVPKPAERSRVAARQGVAGERDHLTWGQIEQHRVGGRQFGKRFDTVVALERPAQTFEHPDQCVGDLLGTASRHRPTDDVGENAEHQPVPSRHRRSQRQDRVTGKASEQRPRLVAAESVLGHGVCRQEPDGAVSTERDRMLRRDRERRQQRVGQVEPRRHERTEQATIRRAIIAEPRRGLVDRSVEHCGPAPIQRMNERHIGMDPLESVIGERIECGDLAERRRPDGERVDRRAHVVDRAGRR